MRRFLLRNRWASVLVACLLLFATSGMAVSRMTCLVGGHSVVSIGSFTDCCPAPADNEGAMLKAECCEYLVAKNDGKDLLPGAPLVWMPSVLFAEALPWMSVSTEDGIVVHFLETRPPPGSVPARLALLGQYRI